ncbi:hypothetical protein H9P43_008667 [Blastocladiella emersonii ATCC 22665]|nr:hypothetical protein H9P43_008667 [Blastocladiella emersonii ATCC 22665]
MLTCRTPYRGNRLGRYRPYRKHFPRDLFLYHDACARPELRALLCGCGDLAELARTVTEAAAKGSTATLSFVLNDWQPEILARNLLILQAISFCSEGGIAPPDSPLRVLDENTQRELRRIWHAWLKCDWTVEKLSKEREDFVAKSCVDKDNPNDLGLDAAEKCSCMASGLVFYANAQYRGVLKGAESARITCNLERLGMVGVSTRRIESKRSVVNWTMLFVGMDGELYYALEQNTLATDVFDLFLGRGSPESPNYTTRGFVFKLLANAFAAGRIVREGSRPYPLAPWSGCNEEDVFALMSLSGCTDADRVALASFSRQYGFAAAKNSTDLFCLELEIPADDSTSLSPQPLALEIIRPPNEVFRFESLRVKPVYGTPPRIRVSTNLALESLVIGAPAGTKIGVYREPLSADFSAAIIRELVGGKFFPLSAATVTRIPICGSSPSLSALIQSPVEEAKRIALHFAFEPGAPTKFTLLPRYEVKRDQGAVTLLVDGVRVTARVSSPAYVAKVQIKRKQGRVTLLLTRIMNWAATDFVNNLHPSVAGITFRTANVMRLLSAAKSTEATAAGVVEFTRLIFETFAAGHRVVAHCGLLNQPVLLIFFDRPVLVSSAGPSTHPTPALECTVSMIDDPHDPSPDEDETNRRAEILARCLCAVAGRLSMTTLPRESTAAYMAFRFLALPEPVPEHDGRFDADLYKVLRPILRRALIMPAYPACRSEADLMGPELEEFLERDNPDARIPTPLTCRALFRGSRVQKYRPSRHLPPRDFFLYHDDWVNAPPGSPLRVIDEDTQRELRRIWRAWLTSDWSVEKLTKARDELAATAITIGMTATKYRERITADFMDDLDAQYRGVLKGAESARMACNVERLEQCIKGVAQRTLLHNGPNYTTRSFFIKLFAFAFAAGRLVYLGTDPYTTPYWSDCMKTLFIHMSTYGEDDATTIPFSAPFQRYGFADLQKPGSFVTHCLELVLPLADDNESALLCGSPLVLEIIRPNGESFRFEDFHVELVYGTPPRMRLVANLALPTMFHNVPAGTTVGVFCEPFPSSFNPAPQRTLIGGKLFPLSSVTVTRIPLTAPSPALRGLMRSRPTLPRFGPRDLPTWPLPAEQVLEEPDLTALTFKFGEGAPTKFTLPPQPEIAQSQGVATLIVDGVRQTTRLTCPVRVTKVQVARKTGRVTLLLKRSLNADRDILLFPSLPRIGRRYPASPEHRLWQHSIRAAMCAATDSVNTLYPPVEGIILRSANVMQLLSAAESSKIIAASVVELTRLVFEAFASGHHGELRPNLKRVLIMPAYPTCRSEADELGPKLAAFMKKGI